MLKYNLKGFLPLFIYSLLLFACKKEVSDVGLNLKPGNSSLEGQLITFKGNAKTVLEDSIVTSDLSYSLLGQINDPIFGTSKTSLVCRPSLTATGFDFNGSSLDSIVLVMAFQQSQRLGPTESYNPLYVGDTNQTIRFNVHTLGDGLSSSRLYYADDKPNTDQLVGNFTGKVHIRKEVTMVFNKDTIKQPPQLRIKLDRSFGELLLSKPSSDYTNNAAFYKILKGLVISPVNFPGDGLMFSVNLLNQFSRLELFYTTKDAVKSKASFNFTIGSPQYNYFEHTISNAAILQQISAPKGQHFNKTYCQFIKGAKVKLEIPDLVNFIDTVGVVVINQATVRYSLDQTSVSTTFDHPFSMRLFKPNPVTDKNDSIPDFSFTSSYYGDRYNKDIAGFSFQFNRYCQELVTRKSKGLPLDFNGFYLTIPKDRPMVYSRAVLNTDFDNGGIEISVRYTKLN